MKIKITESQYKKIINEVGGYDDQNVMASHGANVHGTISRSVSETIYMIAEIMEYLEDGEVGKMDIMTAVTNLSNKFSEDIKLIKGLSKEIFLDNDFKELVINYMNSTSKILKYFRMLSGYSAGIMGGQPTNLSYGLGMSMSDTELRSTVKEKILSLGDYLLELSEMFHTIVKRYASRLGY
jgi:hypothetical protein